MSDSGILNETEWEKRADKIFLSILMLIVSKQDAMAGKNLIANALATAYKEGLKWTNIIYSAKTSRTIFKEEVEWPLKVERTVSLPTFGNPTAVLIEYGTNRILSSKVSAVNAVELLVTSRSEFAKIQYSIDNLASIWIDVNPSHVDIGCTVTGPSFADIWKAVRFSD